MQVYRKIVDLQNALFDERKKGKKIGFVPTMGALHEGHASLVRRSVKDNDVTVVSVFVNPTQFNDKNDLKNYPRDLEADCRVVESCGADFVFAPDVEATRAYFGEKDWQQIAVIKAMVRALSIQVEIVECPIVRDDDGLARSSRNTLLSPDERAIAPKIYEALKAGKDYAKKHTVQETHDYVVKMIDAVKGLKVEYFAIVDGDTLLDIQEWKDHAVGCITVYCGKTPIRLIDHIKFC